MRYRAYREQRIAEIVAERDMVCEGIERVPGLLELVRHVQPHRMLEIGSFKGISTEIFLLHIPLVVSLDPWENDHGFEEFVSRAGGYPGCSFVRGYSPRDVPDGPFDFVYIDAVHTYDAVIADIKACEKYDLTWIGGHDYHAPAVEAAVTHVFPTDKPRTFSDTSWLINLKGV